MTDEYGLGRAAGAADGLASPADEVAFQDAFLRLVERRTAIYTMGDSSSVPTYLAVDLVRSICFVLGIDLEEGTAPGTCFGSISSGSSGAVSPRSGGR